MQDIDPCCHTEGNTFQYGDQQKKITFLFAEEWTHSTHLEGKKHWKTGQWLNHTKSWQIWIFGQTEMIIAFSHNDDGFYEGRRKNTSTLCLTTQWTSTIL